MSDLFASYCTALTGTYFCFLNRSVGSGPLAMCDDRGSPGEKSQASIYISWYVNKPGLCRIPWDISGSGKKNKGWGHECASALEAENLASLRGLRRTIKADLQLRLSQKLKLDPSPSALGAGLVYSKCSPHDHHFPFLFSSPPHGPDLALGSAGLTVCELCSRPRGPAYLCALLLLRVRVYHVYTTTVVVLSHITLPTRPRSLSL